MPLELARASAADLRKLLEIQFAAFAEDPMNAVMFPVPTPPSAFEKALERARNDFQDPDVAFVKVTDTDIGEIVSYARWFIWKHERPEEEWNKEKKRDWGEGTNVEAADAFVGAINEKRRKIMAGKPHCCK